MTSATTQYKTVFRVSTDQEPKYVQIIFRSQPKKEDHEASAYADLYSDLQQVLNNITIQTEDEGCPILEECSPDHSYEAQLDLSREHYYY